MSAFTPAGSPYPTPQSHAHALHNPLTAEGYDPLVQHHNLAPAPPYAYEQVPPPHYGNAGPGNDIGAHGIGAGGRPPSQAVGHEEEHLNAGASHSDGNKGNRLRKACDSCSIRKVKVSQHIA